MYFQSAFKKLVSDDCNFPNVTFELVVIFAVPHFFLATLWTPQSYVCVSFRIQDRGCQPCFFNYFKVFGVDEHVFFVFPFCVKRKSYLFFRGPDKLGRRPLDDCRRGSLAPTQLIVNVTGKSDVFREVPG